MLCYCRPGLGDRGIVPVRQVLRRTVRFHPVFLRHHRAVSDVHVPEVTLLLPGDRVQRWLWCDIQHRGGQCHVRVGLYTGMHTEERAVVNASV
jgi:hypothetical protein